jgi:hypothetical protein
MPLQGKKNKFKLVTSLLMYEMTVPAYSVIFACCLLVLGTSWLQQPQQQVFAQGTSLQERFMQSSNLFSQQTLANTTNSSSADNTPVPFSSSSTPPVSALPQSSSSPSLSQQSTSANSNAPIADSTQVGSEIGTGAQSQKIVQQGTVTSSVDPLPGHEGHQSASILRLRSDDGIYSGVVTFTASNEVEIQVFHKVSDSSSPTEISIPESFGPLTVTPLPDGSGSIIITSIVPDYGSSGPFTASIPFSGNSLSLHNVEGEPFAATYTVTADVLGPANKANDIGTGPATTTNGSTSESDDDNGADADDEENN